MLGAVALVLYESGLALSRGGRVRAVNPATRGRNDQDRRRRRRLRRSWACCARVAASGGGNNKSSSTGCGRQQRRQGGKIALLLPETKTARYETQDRPLFEARSRSSAPDCQVIYCNANQDAAKQQQQAEAALTQGAKVLVLDPVDAAPPPRSSPRPRGRRCRSSATTD